jgi:Cu/Ag efflux protein CusF
MPDHPALVRAATFCETFNLRVPILMAPMGSVSPTSLAIAVANAGGLGGCGAVVMRPDAISAWASDVRARSNGAFQLNLWIPDPTPKRDMAAEDAVRDFLRNWGPEVAREAGNFMLPDFTAHGHGVVDMKTALSVTFIALGIIFTSSAIAQDVQGIRSGMSGKTQSIQEGVGSCTSEALKGEVATVDETSRKISIIKLSGTVGSSNPSTPTPFKVQDSLIFNTVKPGDKVSFTAECINQEMTITKLTRE